jgi:hypothetical protein
MLDNPINFSSSPSFSEDDLPAHQSSEEDISSSDWRSFDYSPLWSFEKEDPKEEDEDDADAEDNDDDSDDFDSDDSDSDFDFTSPPPKRVRQGEDHVFRLSSL